MQTIYLISIPLIGTLVLALIALSIGVAALVKVLAVDRSVEEFRNHLFRLEQSAQQQRNTGLASPPRQLTDRVLGEVLQRALSDPESLTARTLMEFAKKHAHATSSAAASAPQFHQRPTATPPDWQDAPPPERVYFGRPGASGTWPKNAVTDVKAPQSIFSAEIWEGYTAKVPFELLRDPQTVRRLCDRPQDFASSALEIHSDPGARATRVDKSVKGLAAKNPDSTWRVLKPASISLA